MRQKFKIKGEVLETVVVLTDGAGIITIGAERFEVAEVMREGNKLRFTFQDRNYSFSVLNTPEALLITDGVSYHSFQCVEPGLEETGDEAGGSLTSKMPGTVLQCLVATGTLVTKGTPVLILEAMKMEHEICAAADGVVESYPFQPGDRVMPGDLLVNFTAAENS